MNDQHTITTRANPRTVTLPLAPVTASPVPHLTSIHGAVERGPYGTGNYRGNCGGYLIRDLLAYFRPQRVLDPMHGGGTCRDVCRHAGIDCVSFDLKTGQDAADPSSYAGLGAFNFVWMHPPYWRMIRYNDDPRCLSSVPTLDAFLDRLRQVLTCSRDVLAEDGVIAVLIGGYSDWNSTTRRRRYIPLPALTNQVAAEAGLWPVCTEIVRFQHGNTSIRKTYRSSFIPGLHDICIIFGRK